VTQAGEAWIAGLCAVKSVASPSIVSKIESVEGTTTAHNVSIKVEKTCSEKTASTRPSKTPTPKPAKGFSSDSASCSDDTDDDDDDGVPFVTLIARAHMREDRKFRVAPSHAPSPVPASVPTPQEGDRVELCGMATAALNGARGSCVQWNQERERFTVCLDDGR
jgi:hypothetical protein